MKPAQKKHQATLNTHSEDSIDTVPIWYTESIPSLEKQRKRVSTAVKALLGYIVLWSVVVFTTSNSFLGVWGLTGSSFSHLSFLKQCVFLLATAPLVYWLVQKSEQKLARRDIQLEHIQHRLLQLNQIYQILRQVNQVILRIANRQQLLEEVCDVLCGCEKFAFVWVGLGQTDAGALRVIISKGQNNHYLEDLFDALQMQALEEKGEPSLAVLRKKVPVIINDVFSFSKHKRFAWQKRALENNFCSIAAFPIKTTSGVEGVLALYSKCTSLYSAEEVEWLSELAEDISYALSHVEQKENIYYAANFDMVTSLPNKPLFEDRVEQAIARALHEKRYLGIAVIALVDLPNIIGTYGQVAADKLLQETARHLSHLVRDGDTIGRLGRNEIGIMFRNLADPDDVAIVLEKLLKPFLMNLTYKKEISVIMQAGVTLYPKDGDNAATLIKNAETALQKRDPNEKMNCSFYSSQISSGVIYFQHILKALEGAIERNEFYMQYQPIVDVLTRKVVGVEGLVRWRNETLGEIAPIQFYLAAEEKGVAAQLGDWILSKVCQQLIDWQKAGIENLTMSINFPIKRLITEEYLARIATLFEEIGFQPTEHSLAIEIPESILVDEPGQMISIFNHLHEMGLKIYIDDFGTGYASLNYLHKLPVDALKIDAMFARNIEKDRASKALVRGMLAFANGYGLISIAEGVETEKQLKIFKELGCNMVQGHVFSAPRVEKNITPMLSKKL